jgi:hypothetical protein
MHEHGAPDPQDTSNARESNGEPQAGPGSTDKQQTGRTIGYPEGGGGDDVCVMWVHGELRHMRQARDDEECGGEALRMV